MTRRCTRFCTTGPRSSWEGELEQVRLLGGSAVLARLDDLLRATLLARWSLLAVPDAPRELTKVSGHIDR